ncbi:MAG: proline dehydrogenase family protein [Candidatus Melainabacteria bacterium]
MPAKSLLYRMVATTLPVVPRPLVKTFGRRYVAGESMAEMVSVVQRLNGIGARCTVDLLGEFITGMDQAEATLRAYLDILDTLHARGLNANVSVKLTALGLLLDEAACLAHMRTLVAHAKTLGNFVRIDMEDSACTDRTLALYLALRREYDNVGIVLQAYLHRTLNDMHDLVREDAGHFRLCKGIYKEPAAIAFQDEDINRNYLHVLEAMFQQGAYVGIATHHHDLVTGAKALIEKYNVPKTGYEFQMLLGVDAALRDSLLEEGHPLRIYVPFGEEWYAYCLRRLKENPDIVGHILGNLLKPGGNRRVA